jgi:hypothetical protein
MNKRRGSGCALMISDHKSDTMKELYYYFNLYFMSERKPQSMLEVNEAPTISRQEVVQALNALTKNGQTSLKEFEGSEDPKVQEAFKLFLDYYAQQHDQAAGNPEKIKAAVLNREQILEEAGITE